MEKTGIILDYLFMNHIIVFKLDFSAQTLSAHIHMYNVLKKLKHTDHLNKMIYIKLIYFTCLFKTCKRLYIHFKWISHLKLIIKYIYSYYVLKDR